MASTSFLPVIFLDNSFSSFLTSKIDLAFLKIDLASPNLTVIVHSVQDICPKVTGGLSRLYLVDRMKCFFIWMVKVCIWIGGSRLFLLLVKFCQKEKLKTNFLDEEMTFWGFQSPEVRKKYSNHQIHIFGFSLCSQKYRRMIEHLYLISGFIAIFGYIFPGVMIIISSASSYGWLPLWL